MRQFLPSSVTERNSEGECVIDLLFPRQCVVNDFLEYQCMSLALAGPVPPTFVEVSFSLASASGCGRSS